MPKITWVQVLNWTEIRSSRDLYVAHSQTAQQQPAFLMLSVLSLDREPRHSHLPWYQFVACLDTDP